MTDKAEPDFNTVLRRRPPPGRLGRRLLESWGLVDDDDDDVDQPGNDNPPANPAA